MSDSEGSQTNRRIPEDPLSFIRECVIDGRVFWTYHVNMRMSSRSISRDVVLEASSSYEIIESYPEDKYLPSFLVWAEGPLGVFHVVFATDLVEGMVRVVTVYWPDPDEWSGDLKRRLR